MADDKEYRFRPRLGKPRARGDATARKYVNRVLAAVSRAGSPGAFGGRTRRGVGARSVMGRGSLAARMAGRSHPAYRQSRFRRVVIKARFVKLAGDGMAKAGAHLRYVQRDGAGRDGAPGRLYDAESDEVDRKAFQERWEGDRHQFRLIVSPEDAAELGDLKPFIRDLMSRMEEDLGTRLDWVAVDHFNTENPHTHVILRGRDDRGRDLMIARDYISHGMRRRASELLTLELGPRSDIEIQNQIGNEVEQDHFTGLDRRLLRGALEQVIDLRHVPSEDPQGAFVRNAMIGRVRKLQRMGLAEEIESGRWRLDGGMQSTLRRAGLRRDIIKTIHAEMSRLGIEHGPADYQIYDATDPSARSLVGRVVSKGIGDEFNDRHYLIVDGVEGKTHYVDIGRDRDFGEYGEGQIVEIKPQRSDPRAADRMIADVAACNGGIYSPEFHQRFDRRASPNFVQSHVRRLEALRRAGHVMRMPDGTWTIPGDYLDRAIAYEKDRSRWRPVAVTIQSYWSLDRQVSADGATWLDRQLTERSSLPIHDTGFGGEVKKALEARRRRLVQQYRAFERNGETRYERNLLSVLRRIEVNQAGDALAKESGKTFAQPRRGDRVEGVYRKSIDLASGRFAVIETAKEFALVPWRPVLERARGRAVSGLARDAGSISWDIIPRSVDNDPFDGARRPAGQARPAARCRRIAQGSQRSRRAAARHRRPGLLDRPRRCAPLTVQGTATRSAPGERASKPGQMSHYHRSLVLPARAGRQFRETSQAWIGSAPQKTTSGWRWLFEETPRKPTSGVW